MSTAKLTCPQCHRELPARFANGGVCPACRNTFVTPEIKSAPLRQPTVAKVPIARPARATAYLPPIVERESSSGKRALVALLLLLLLGGGASAYFWMNRAPADQPGAQTPNAPLLVADASKKKANEPAIKTPSVPAPPLVPPGQAKQGDVVAKKDPIPPPEIDPVVTTVPQKKVERKLVDAVPSEPPPGLAPFEFKQPQVVKKRMPGSPAVDQKKVDDAIRDGVEWLKQNEKQWINAGGHPLGYASLPALALLECEVPKDDPVIQKAAAAVRKHAPANMGTYEMSLAILFLDRLGDKEDEPLIRTLALRLVAGQRPLYGWDYQCAPVRPDLEEPLLTMLDKLRPQGRWEIPLGREPGKSLIQLAMPLDTGPSRIKLDTPLGAPPLEFKVEKKDDAPKFMLGDALKTLEIVEAAPKELRNLPVADVFDVLSVAAPKPGVPGKFEVRRRNAPAGARDDNSNSQFALLALWAARRHGVPVERSLLLADQRYATSQDAGGGWGYHVGHGGTPPMTCVGLLGLAMGHGVLLGDAKDAPKAQEKGDPAIARGLEALGKSIGNPGDPIGVGNNLYYLWSVERVGMLYQIDKIGGKDWYGWGANWLLGEQKPAGYWPGSGYPGTSPPLDTAFALLFLHRSNLVADLSERLQLGVVIQDERK